MSQSSYVQNNKNTKRSSDKKEFEEDHYKSNKSKEKKKDFSKQREQKRGDFM
jgi:hypothetical protein